MMKSEGRVNQVIRFGVLAILVWTVTANAQEGEVSWRRQFGGEATDEALGVYTDGRAVFVGGLAYRPEGFPGINGFLRCYDRAGRLLWERQFGETSRPTRVQAVTGDGTSVYVAGYTSAQLEPPGVGGGDAFVQKYDLDGNLLWTRQFGSTRGDFARGATADSTGVYVVGDTEGALPGNTNAGAVDIFAVKFDSNGNQLWASQWGTADPEYGYAAATAAGGVAVVGHRLRANGDADGFLRWLDRATGVTRWNKEFGTPGFDSAQAVAASWEGIFVGGQTTGSFGGAANAGGSDGFLMRFELDGTRSWNRGIRTPGYDSVSGIALRWDQVYVTGTTEGRLPGQTPAGLGDQFVRGYDLDGGTLWTLQFGTKNYDRGTAIAARHSILTAVGAVEVPIPAGVNIEGVVVRLDEN